MRASLLSPFTCLRFSRRTATLLPTAVAAVTPQLFVGNNARAVSQPAITDFFAFWSGSEFSYPHADLAFGMEWSNGSDYGAPDYPKMHAYVGTDTSGPWTQLDDNTRGGTSGIDDYAVAGVQAADTTYYGWLQAEDSMSNLSDPSDILEYYIDDRPY